VASGKISGSIVEISGRFLEPVSPVFLVTGSVPVSSVVVCCCSVWSMSPL